ncbi:MAG: Rne/Rng family ribonuclease [Desulfovibrionaceae bacterium]|nr:Rne/Rng family ribonuclease [Desulfovibrionaceae bacterium]
MADPKGITVKESATSAETSGAEKKKPAARKTTKAPAKSAEDAKTAPKGQAGRTAKKAEAAKAADASEKKTTGRAARQTGTSKSKNTEVPAITEQKAAPAQGKTAEKAAPSKAAAPAKSTRKKSVVAQADAGQSAPPTAAVPAEAAPAEKKPSSRSRGRAQKTSTKAPKSGTAANATPSGKDRAKDAAPVAAEETEKPSPVRPKQAAAKEAAPALVPADFPSGFDDAGPEDFFVGSAGVAAADNGEGATETGERKRRGRSRRGRGRKKAAAQAALAANQAADNGENGEPEAPVVFEELFETDEDEGDEGRTSRKDKSSDVKAQGKTPRRKMFVSVLPEEQIEVVITEEGQVQEYYVEMLHQAKTKGNIYKGIVHNVDPNLQAAFVSYGAVKNGFLQIDEVHPEYYVSPHDAGKGRKYPPIQKVLKAGQELLVQIVKEPAGTKGAFLTTYLSMPGRFLVLTPGREQIGVSRKVENETERARLRELLEGLSPGPGLGVIVRTVSMGASKTSLQRDLQYLKRTWKDVRTRGTTEKAPCLVYQEMDLTSRAVRDYLTEAVGEVWIDDDATAAAVTEIAEALFPRKHNLVRAHKDTGTTLFERFNIQRQLDQIQSREVVLPSGGRLVIDATEALTAIDINSGRSGGKNNFEDMAFRTNMEAARMIPLQLRLRDIGGQVVADFIEMRDKSHWREVEKTLRNGMKVDRARHDVGKIGPFGMLEIVRQRLGSSAISISTEPCPCCGGTGVRRNMEWQSQHSLRDILRLLRNAQAHNESVVSYSAEQPLALHLLNNKRQRLLEMEQQYGVRVDIQVKPQELL